MRCNYAICNYAMPVRFCDATMLHAIMQCDYAMRLCNAIMLHAIMLHAIMRCDYATCNLCHAIMHIYKKQKKLLQRSALNDSLKVSASSTTQHDGSSRGRQ